MIVNLHLEQGEIVSKFIYSLNRKKSFVVENIFLPVLGKKYDLCKIWIIRLRKNNIHCSTRIDFYLYTCKDILADNLTTGGAK